jgi:hypothetical protein
MREALAQLQKGLELLAKLTGGADRDEKELHIQIALGHAIAATEGFGAPQLNQAFARARYLCEQLKRPQDLGPVLRGQFNFSIFHGELEQAELYA